MLDRDNIPKTTHERLYALRKDRGLTQQQVAEAIGSNRTTISTWEHGERKQGGYTVSVSPSIDNLLKFANLYGVSVDFLLCRSDFISPDNEYIGKLTGLSDEAIERLKSWNYVDIIGKDTIGGKIRRVDLAEIVSAFLADDDTDDMMTMFVDGLLKVRLEEKEAVKAFMENMESDGAAYYDGDRTNNRIAYRWQISQVFSAILNRLEKEFQNRIYNNA